MVTVFVFFFLRCMICVALYGSLLIAGEKKSKMWRNSLYIGMVLNGVAGFGYLLPQFIPKADFWGLLGNAIMLVGVFSSYFFSVPPQGPEIRRTLVRELGAILVGATVVAVFVSISSGKQAEIRVQQSLANVVYALSNEVRDLRNTVNLVKKKADVIENQTGRADSVARLKPIKKP